MARLAKTEPTQKHERNQTPVAGGVGRQATMTTKIDNESERFRAIAKLQSIRDCPQTGSEKSAEADYAISLVLNRLESGQLFSQECAARCEAHSWTNQDPGGANADLVRLTYQVSG